MTNGKCKEGCGECCIYFPMQPSFIRSKRKFAKAAIIKEVPFKNLILPLTEDGMCFLLDRETKKCVVYKSRPDVCKLFGTIKPMLCPYYDFKGNNRPESESLMLQDYYRLSKERRLVEYKLAEVM